MREVYVDNAKAVGIILMVVGHCYWLNAVPFASSIIYSFHMPLFFVLAGFFVKPLNMKQALIKYLRRLIVPFLLTCFLMFIVDVAYDGLTPTLLNDWIDSLLGRQWPDWVWPQKPRLVHYGFCQRCSGLVLYILL